MDSLRYLLVVVDALTRDWSISNVASKPSHTPSTKVVCLGMPRKDNNMIWGDVAVAVMRDRRSGTRKLATAGCERRGLRRGNRRKLVSHYTGCKWKRILSIRHVMSITVPVMRSSEWKRDARSMVDSSCVDMGWNKLSMPNRPMPYIRTEKERVLEVVT